MSELLSILCLNSGYYYIIDKKREEHFGSIGIKGEKIFLHCIIYVELHTLSAITFKLVHHIAHASRAVHILFLQNITN